MLGVFKGSVVNPPKELHSPASTHVCGRPKTPEDALKDFLASNPHDGFSLVFEDKAILAYGPPQPPLMPRQRLFCGVEDVYCIFLGSLNNLCTLNKQYGLTKGTNEAMFVIEAYRTLRDRSPMPAHRVIKELDGSFGFVLYDHKYATVFAALVSIINSLGFVLYDHKYATVFGALGADKKVNLHWGVAADGSVMISDNVGIIKASCRQSFAPFPPGCLYHSERGLMSFEHPMHKMKAMPRIDSEGQMCGSYFAVDAFAKVNTMPRVGSTSNWATWG